MSCERPLTYSVGLAAGPSPTSSAHAGGRRLAARKFDSAGLRLHAWIPDAVGLSIVAMTSWRRTPSAMWATVCFLLSMFAANAASVRTTLNAGAPCRPVGAGHFCAGAAGDSKLGELAPPMCSCDGQLGRTITGLMVRASAASCAASLICSKA